jgi:hypothetical protein
MTPREKCAREDLRVTVFHLRASLDDANEEIARLRQHSFRAAVEALPAEAGRKTKMGFGDVYGIDVTELENVADWLEQRGHDYPVTDPTPARLAKG